MLKSISVKNYVLIDDLTVDFDSGLNIITGETGAGKSILINAIDIAFGAKYSKDVIKSGSDKALIELFFDCSNNQKVKELFILNEIEFSDEIIISKEISATSSRTRVNGTLVNQDFIRNLRELFIDIHSQHQTYAFLQPKSHIVLLDNYAKDLYGDKLLQYRTLYKKYRDLLNELQIAKDSANATESQIDFLRFQINEIEQAQIDDINEENDLMNELSVLQNAEKLKELTQGAYWAINGDESSLLDALIKIKADVSKAVSMDNSLSDTENMLIDLTEIAREVSNNLRDYSSSVSNDTERLNYVQERLYVFDKLKRKYGATLEEVLNTYDGLVKELNNIEFSTARIDELNMQIESILGDLNSLATEISVNRKNYANVLSSLIEEELEKLELKKSRFEIRIKPIELCIDGIDNVEFYISTNVSKDLSPLAQTASGGEISRVMLAIKTIFAKADDIDTVVFDEIDTGISGKAAQSVADEIAELAKLRQIIVITHQAIIAAKANRHFQVLKSQLDTTSVEISVLDEDGRVNALASLASGDVCESSVEFAKSLLLGNK